MKYSANKFPYLLIVLLGFFITDAFVVGNRFIFGLLFTFIILFCVYTVGHNKKLLFIGAVLALLSLVGHWLVSFIFPLKELYLLDFLFTIVFLLFITAVTLNYVVKDRRVTLNTLCGAIAGYLLIGLIWTFIYTTILVLQPQAFSMSTELLHHMSTIPQHFIYYSFVTLSTLGYGDITPLANAAKTFAWLEAVTGQIYLTIWIAHLVGMYIFNRNKESS